MKLSQLVLLKDQLDGLNIDSLENNLSAMLNQLSHITDNSDYSLSTEQANVAVAVSTFNQSVRELKLKIKQDITKLEPSYFVESYNAYKLELVRSAKVIQSNISNPFANLDLSLFKARLNRYADWHYPAAIIRPNIEPFIENMVAHDPLYVLDVSHELLEPALNKFNTQYQERLRISVINETDSGPLLPSLPDNQLGVVFAYNFLNFRPIEIFKRYLTEIYQKLKPGGVFILTFNDCERASAVENTEIRFAVYTPGYLIYELARLTGFEIEYYWHDNGPSTWLELRKPGTLSSLKGGQTLAKILPKQL